MKKPIKLIILCFLLLSVVLLFSAYNRSEAVKDRPMIKRQVEETYIV